MPSPEASEPEGGAPSSSELELIDVVGLEFDWNDDTIGAAGEDAPGADPADEASWDDSAGISASKLAVDVAPIADDATLSMTDLADDELTGNLSKTEQALLDLAGVGVTVGKAVEIIPEDASDVYAALTGLIAMGVISIH